MIAVPLGARTGYPWTLPRGTYLGREQPILLRVPCVECAGWHSYGAGTVQAPYYAAGDVTNRAPHCRVASDWAGDIVVDPVPFRPVWITPTGRISARYRDHVLGTCS